VDQRNRGQLEFVVPDRFWSEIGNIPWKAAQATLITADEKLANATAAHLRVKWVDSFK
jgi:hypothetical protein